MTMLWKSCFAASMVLLGTLGCSSNSSTSADDREAPGEAEDHGDAGGGSGAPRGDASVGGGSKSGGGSGTSGASGNRTDSDARATSGGASGRSGGSSGASGNRIDAGRDAVSGSASGRSGGSSDATSNGKDGETGDGGDTVNATAMVSAMGFGTNIGNTLENTTTWETGWGQPLITQAYIRGMASRGIKTVRVPVAWDTYATNGVIDASKANRVKEVVGWIESAGMYSIVNIHWDGGWIFNESNTNKYKLTDDVKTKFTSYWTQISAVFGAVGHKLVFEGLNEEAQFYVGGNSNNAPDYAALNQLNQLFVTTVRAQGGYNASRALLIAGFKTDIDLTCVDAFTVPSDPAGAGKLFLSVHYYTPYTFCGLDSVESWGSPQTTWGTNADKTMLEGIFTKLAAFSTKKKIPVILGEFGVTLGEKYPRDPASRTLWMESVAKASMTRNIVPVLWDTGSEIKRTDGSFSKEFQAVMDHIQP